MVATTHVRFFVGVNYEVDLNKTSSPVKPGFGSFLSREKIFFFLMKIVGTVLPHRLSLLYCLLWLQQVSYFRTSYV
jgi:hypothetical protein